MSSQGLPTTWTLEPLSSIADVVQGQSPPGSTYNAHGDGMPFFQGKAEFGPIHPVASKWCTEPSKLAEPGDILISIRAPVGPTNLADSQCCIGRGLAALRPRRGVPPRFLLYYLRYTDSLLARQATGSTFQAIGGAQLRNHPVVVPPSPEQHRIVAAIESYFTRLDDAVATLERAQRNLKRYRASVLKSAVEGRLVPTEAELARVQGRDYEPASVLLQRILAERRRRWEEAELAKMTAKGKAPKDDKWKAKYVEPVAPDTSELPELPEGWCWASVDQIAAVKGGITKGQRIRRGQPYREVPYLRVANVQRGYLDLSEMKTIQAFEAQINELRLEPGDVLFNEGGDRDKLGRGWIWRGEVPECIHQNHVFRARLHTDALLPELLSWYGNTSGQQYFFDKGTQTTNLASINMTKLRGLPVPLPPRAEQMRIRQLVEEQLSVSDAVSATVSIEVARLTRLRQSILKWAFEGRLVDQDPTDEPAAVLLERIRAERTSSDTKKPKRPTRRKARSTNA